MNNPTTTEVKTHQCCCIWEPAGGSGHHQCTCEVEGFDNPFCAHCETRHAPFTDGRIGAILNDRIVWNV